jgi:hypothetical protein
LPFRAPQSSQSQVRTQEGEKKTSKETRESGGIFKWRVVKGEDPFVYVKEEEEEFEFGA